MRIEGGCLCNNLRVSWRLVDFSLVPRACQCEYCRSKAAAYVSKSGTTFTLRVHSANLHRVVTQSSEQARFHECAHCGELVCVTAEIDGECYGALNVHTLRDAARFAPPRTTDFGGQSAGDKALRWQQNWCSPVRFD